MKLQNRAIFGKLTNMSDLFKSQFHLDPDYLDKLHEDGYYSYFLSDDFLNGMLIISKWLNSIPESLSVLEIGSGRSPILKRLGANHRYVGIELSKKAVDECITTWTDRPNTEFIHGDIESLFDHLNLQADVLYSGNTLYYIKDDKRLPFVLKVMDKINARYLILCEVESVNIPVHKDLRLIFTEKFYLDADKDHKKIRRIEIYEYARKDK